MSDGYPLHDQMLARETERAAMQEMLDWLQANGYAICKWIEFEDYCEGQYRPISTPLGDLIGGAMGIDPKELEKEKVRMLESLRG